MTGGWIKGGDPNLTKLGTHGEGRDGGRSRITIHSIQRPIHSPFRTHALLLNQIGAMTTGTASASSACVSTVSVG